MYEQQIVSLFRAAILLGSGLLHVDGPLGLYINPKLLKELCALVESGLQDEGQDKDLLIRGSKGILPVTLNRKPRAYRVLRYI
jgi:hypothetical protein